ncbi:MAG: hypothetical protein ABSH06_01550 [Thermodesulfobacteriota bacterium]
MTTETISKIDIACRHLDTAITLWFQESDPISIHLLACASHQIISDIIHHRGGSDPLFDSPYIKPGCRSDAIYAFHKHYNFFKHANRDPEAVIEFNSSAPQYSILNSILSLEQLNIKHNLLQTSFFLYFGFHHPELMEADFFKSFGKGFNIDILPELNLSRREFFEALRQGLSSTTT